MIETLSVLLVISLAVFLFGVPIAMHNSEKWFEKEKKQIYKDIFQLNDRIAKLEEQSLKEVKDE